MNFAFVWIIGLFGFVALFQNCSGVDFIQASQLQSKSSLDVPTEAEYELHRETNENSKEDEASPEDVSENLDPEVDEPEVDEPNIEEKEELIRKHRRLCELSDRQKRDLIQVEEGAVIDSTTGIVSYDGGRIDQINKVRGIISISAEHISSISGLKGIIRIYGKSEGSRIDSIQGFHGVLLVCNMDIGDLKEPGGGIITAVSSSIETIEGHRGIITVRDGDIGLVKNHRGIIIVKNGKIRDRVRCEGIYKSE